MSQCDISATIEDIYGFEISHETISDITDSVLTQLDIDEPLRTYLMNEYGEEEFLQSEYSD